MSVSGGNLENKSLGLILGENGTYENCVLNEGKLELQPIGVDSNSNAIYAEEGTWISEVIEVEDNFNAYSFASSEKITQNGSSITVYTRTSDDGVLFNDWISTTSNGMISSPKAKFIQVKILLKVGFTSISNYISRGNNASDAIDVFNNYFIDTSSGIKTKRQFTYDIVEDESWTEEGVLSRVSIDTRDWLVVREVEVM